MIRPLYKSSNIDDKSNWKYIQSYDNITNKKINTTRSKQEEALFAFINWIPDKESKKKGGWAFNLLFP